MFRLLSVALILALSVSVVDGKKKKKKELIEDEEGPSELEVAIGLTQQALDWVVENTDLSIPAVDLAALSKTFESTMSEIFPEDDENGSSQPDEVPEIKPLDEEDFRECIIPNLYFEPESYAAQPRAAYESMIVPPEELLSTLNLGSEGLPANLQGIFWLNQAKQRPLQVISFAPSREIGGLNPSPLTPGPFAFRHRVNGDKTWATSLDNPIGGFEDALIEAFDVKYNWQVVEGTLEDPTEFRVVVDVGLPDSCLRFLVQDCLTDYLDLGMTLQNTPDSVVDGFVPSEEFPNSVVWTRGTTTSGSIYYDYEIVQIADVNGVPIQPAYDIWMQEDGASDFYLNQLMMPEMQPTCPSMVDFFV